MCDEYMEKLELPYLVRDSAKWSKYSLEVIGLSIKLNISISFDPAIPLLGENATEKHACDKKTIYNSFHKSTILITKQL